MSSSDRVSGVVDQDAEAVGRPPATDRTVQARRREGNESAGVQQEKSAGEAGTASTQEQTSEKAESVEADDRRPAVSAYTGPFESREEEFAARRRSREAAAEYNANLDEDREATPLGQPADTGPTSARDGGPRPGFADRDEGAASSAVESGTAIEADDRRPAVSAYTGPFESREEEFAARRRSREAAAEYNANLDESREATPSVQPPDTAPASAPDEAQQQTFDDRDEGAASPVLESGTQSDADASYPLPGEEHIPVTRAESRAQALAANAESRSEVREAGTADRDADGALAAFGTDAASDASAEASETAEQRDRVSSAAEAPASSDVAPQTVADGIEPAETGRAWQDHVEDMKAEWADHEARWPEGPPEGGPPDGEPPDEGVRGGGTSADRPGDEPGSWRGDGGQYLNHEENYSVARSFDRISTSEPEVTDALRSSEAKVDAAELVGLEYRTKGEDRFKEKVAEQLAAEYRENPRKVAELTPDALRYTYQISAGSYSSAYRAIVDDLSKSGHEMVFSRNTWDGAEYKGINTRWRTQAGQLFEVQFHTPESFEAKQLTHGAYERLRNPMTSGPELAELKAYQRNASSAIPIPDGALDIPNYRKMES